MMDVWHLLNGVTMITAIGNESKQWAGGGREPHHPFLEMFEWKRGKGGKK